MLSGFIATLKRNYFLGNSAYVWFRLGLTVLLFISLCFLLGKIIRKPLRYLLHRSGADEKLPRAAIPICFALAGLTFTLFSARFQLRYNVRIDVVLETSSKLSLISFIGLTVYWLLPPLVYTAAVKGKKTAGGGGRSETLANFITVLVRFFAILFGIFAVLSVFGINVSGILAGVGLGGLAISLAAKDTLSNLIGGISIVLDRPFQIGDFVAVDAMSGTVEDIGLRSTRLRTLDDTVVIMPNDKVINNSVINYSKIRRRLITFQLPLSRVNKPEVLQELLQAIDHYMTENHMISPAGKRQYLSTISSFEQQILVECYIKSSDYEVFLKERSRLLHFINTEIGRLQLQVPREARVDLNL